MAARRVIRPKLASVHDGYSRESIEDMLVVWSACWDDERAAQARIDALRTEPAAEPLLAAVWTCCLSKDELALDRARRELQGSPLGAEVVALALRDARFARSLPTFEPTPATFAWWLATLKTGRGPRPPTALGLGRLWAREEPTWNTELSAWSRPRVLDAERRAQLEALLDDEVAEVRAAVALGLTEAWGDREHVTELILARLADPAVACIAADFLQYGTSVGRPELLAKVKGVFSDRLPHRFALLVLMLRLGDSAPACTHFRTLPPGEQRALVAPLSMTAVGKRFLESVVRDERASRLVRREALMMLHDVPGLEAFEALLR